MTLLNESVPAERAGTREAGPVFTPVQKETAEARIRVIGVGGGGGNAVQRMAQENISNVDLICVNTDVQALKLMRHGGETVQIGRETTRGLGAGANPEVGRKAAQESREILEGHLDSTEMLFITAGMGGGTGTGAAPVIAELAREKSLLTVAVVTRPFSFEGEKRTRLAEEGIATLRQHVDSIITIPNDRLLEGQGATMEEAFAAADSVLHNAVRGISDLIVRPGMINVDFADVRTVMAKKGLTMMGSGHAAGEHRAEEAVECAINSRLLEEVDIQGARGMLVNVTTGPEHALTMSEFSIIGERLRPLCAEGADLVIGTARNEDIGDALQVTVVAAGIGVAESESEPVAEVEQKQEAQGRVLDRETVQGRIRSLHSAPVAEAEQEVRVVGAGGGGTAVPSPSPAPEAQTDWSDANTRKDFEVPAYLRYQHD